MKNILIVMFVFSTALCIAQGKNDTDLPAPKRFIDKIEVFAGPNLSFNHGNMFIENYKDENVTNKRLLKPGYVFGIGAYHPFSDRIDLNVRVQYEQKGTKNELSTPWLPDDNRLITYDLYNYNYVTIAVAPNILLGTRKRVLVSFGFYYSRIKRIKGYGKTYDVNGTLSSEGSYQGRYFYDLRDDGTRQGFAWMPNFTGIENNDFGFTLSVGYRLPLGEKHIVLFQLQDNYGIQNINKDNPYDLQEKNHSVALIISYNFKFPPKN